MGLHLGQLHVRFKNRVEFGNTLELERENKQTQTNSGLLLGHYCGGGCCGIERTVVESVCVTVGPPCCHSGL